MIKSTLFIAFCSIFLFSCKKPTKPDYNDTIKTGLIAYYPFNGNTNDESGNANHGAALKNQFTVNHKGETNKAFDFDGTNYIKVPNSVSFSSIKSEISITAWVYNTGQGASIVCKAVHNGPTMQFRLYADQVIMFTNEGSASDFETTLNPVNTWKHVAVVSDGKSSKYYLNGILQTTVVPHSDAAAKDKNSEMYIGADTHGTTEYHSGALDEIRIYNRVLSDEEVMRIYKKQ